MSELDTIQVERRVAGMGRDVSIKEYCLFSTERNGCQLADSIECTYGLTAIHVPRICPLRIGETVMRVTVIKGEDEDDG